MTAFDITLADVTTEDTQKYIGNAILNSSYITDESDFTVTGNTTLNGAITTVNTEGSSTTAFGNIKFGGTIDGLSDLILRADDGEVEIAGDAGVGDRLKSIDADADRIVVSSVLSTLNQIYISDDIELGSDYDSSGGLIEFNGPVELFNGTNVIADLSILFASTVIGEFDLGLNSGGQTTFDDTVGLGSGLGDGFDAAILIDSSGMTVFNGTVETNSGIVANTAGTINFNDDVMIAAGDTGSDFEVTGSLAFNADLDGDTDLTLAVTGGTTFVGDVGSVTPLGDGVEVDPEPSISIEGTSGATEFLGTVDASSGIDQDVGAGIVTFNDDVNIGSDGTASVFDESVVLNGPVEFNSGAGATFGDSSVADDLIINALGGDTVEITSDNADINFKVEVDDFNDGDGLASLIVNAGTGNITADGDIGTEGVGGIGDVEMTGTSIVLHDVISEGTQVYNGDVSFNSIYETNGEDFIVNGNTLLNQAFASVDTGAGLGDIEFNGTIDSATSGLTTFILSAGIGDIDITNDVGSGLNQELQTVEMQGVNIELHDVVTLGPQFYNGNVVFNSDYITNGNDFEVTGDAFVFDDTTVNASGSGGDIDFGGGISGPGDLTLITSDNGDINIGDGQLGIGGIFTIIGGNPELGIFDMNVGGFNIFGLNGGDFTGEVNGAGGFGAAVFTRLISGSQGAFFLNGLLLPVDAIDPG